MGAPWQPPRRPEHNAADEPEVRLQGVLQRLEEAEAELDRMEREASARRRRWWLAFIAGLVVALVLL